MPAASSRRLFGAGAQAEGPGEDEGRRGPKNFALGHDHQREIVDCSMRKLLEPLGLVVPIDVEPAIGHVVAREERLQLVAPLRPAMPDHSNVSGVLRVRLLPVAQQVVDHGVQPLCRWVPRFEQVVVEADVVDRPDRDVGVGIRREQEKLRVGRVPPGLTEHLDARHVRHPLIGGDQSDRSGSQRQLGDGGEGLGSRRRPDDAVVRSVPSTQVAGDRLRHHRVVVDRQDRRLRHGLALRATTPRAKEP